jgi:hypothetical protein
MDLCHGSETRRETFGATRCLFLKQELVCTVSGEVGQPRSITFGCVRRERTARLGILSEVPIERQERQTLGGNGQGSSRRLREEE